MRRRSLRSPRVQTTAFGFSLIELMVVVAVAAVILSLAAPSFTDYIVTQRLRSIHAQLVTDLQYARSEAVSRGAFLSFRVEQSSSGSGKSCYILFTRPNPAVSNPLCSCLEPEGSRCTGSGTPPTAFEVRTVTVDHGQGVSLRTPSGQPSTITFDPRVGGLHVPAADVTILTVTGFTIDVVASGDRALRASILGSGRPLVCTPAGSKLGGTPCS